jgi:hypothetical protein
MPNAPRRMVASQREIPRLITIPMKRSDIRIITGMSRMISPRFTAIGRIRAEIPRISATFAMFEPTTFPTAMSPIPR